MFDGLTQLERQAAMVVLHAYIGGAQMQPEGSDARVLLPFARQAFVLARSGRMAWVADAAEAASKILRLELGDDTWSRLWMSCPAFVDTQELRLNSLMAGEKLAKLAEKMVESAMAGAAKC